MIFQVEYNNQTQYFSNSTVELLQLLTVYCKSDDPYTALIQLEGNEPLTPAEYVKAVEHKAESYHFFIGQDLVTFDTKPNEWYSVANASKIPLGAAYTLLRYHGDPPPEMVTDYEYDEYSDMTGLFGNRDPELKERGFLIFYNQEHFDRHLDYLKSTGNYQTIYPIRVGEAEYLAFDERGLYNIRDFLLIKIMSKRAEVNKLEADYRREFGDKEAADQKNAEPITDPPADDEMEM